MEIQSSDDALTHDNIFIFKFNRMELLHVKLYPCDRLLFDECEKSNKVSDKLLALELIARRIEEIKP